MARTKQLVLSGQIDMWKPQVCTECGLEPCYLETDLCEPCIWAFVREPEPQETEIAPKSS